jgi:hypothetical protein
MACAVLADHLAVKRRCESEKGVPLMSDEGFWVAELTGRCCRLEGMEDSQTCLRFDNAAVQQTANCTEAAAMAMREHH